MKNKINVAIMKKTIFAISVILIGLMIIVVSCSKEETTIDVNTTNKNSNAIKAYNNIQRFRNEIEMFKKNSCY